MTLAVTMQTGSADTTTSLAATLQRLAARLPRAWTFRYELSPTALHLDVLRVHPARAQGQGSGTRLLARVLAAADAAALPVTLAADPSDAPHEPDTETLVRWYARFGFTVVAVDPDTGTPSLRREPRTPHASARAILRDYAAARAAE